MQTEKSAHRMHANGQNRKKEPWTPSSTGRDDGINLTNGKRKRKRTGREDHGGSSGSRSPSGGYLICYSQF